MEEAATAPAEALFDDDGGVRTHDGATPRGGAKKVTRKRQIVESEDTDDEDEAGRVGDARDVADVSAGCGAGGAKRPRQLDDKDEGQEVCTASECIFRLHSSHAYRRMSIRSPIHWLLLSGVGRRPRERRALLQVPQGESGEQGE